MKYDAFISYSHALDGRLAPALQLGLHRFAKPWYRLRAMRVFRDDTTLALTPKLWPGICRSLDESGCLILMASPPAAQSEWVKKEVAHWIGTVPAKPLLIVWTDGQINWPKGAADFDWTRTDALPDELRGYFREGPPLYLDLRWARNEKQLSLKHAQFLEGVGKLASGITGRDLQDLLGQEVTEHRRTRRVATLAMVILTLALCAAIAGAIFALQGQERAQESLYFATIPAVQEASQRGDKIEALRLLENAPEPYRGWEWSFLKRRIGFAPMRLRHSQIAILDTGPLQGSGLRELADRMFDGAAGDAGTAAGITVVNRGGGRGGGHIELLTEEDEISVTTYQASSYGDFGTMCLSPDGSCLLVLTERMRIQTLAGDDFLTPPGALDWEPDGALLHVLPVPAKFDTSQLGRRQSEAAKNDAAEPSVADGDAGQGPRRDEALDPQATEEPASDEGGENQSVFFENYEGRLVCVHANGAREFVARPDPRVPGKARLRLRDRPVPLPQPAGDEEETASTHPELEGALRLLTDEQRAAVQSWHAAKPERLVLAIGWSDTALPCLAVDPKSEELSLIELRHPERVRTATLAGTRPVWLGIRRMGDGAFDAGAAFSRNGNTILFCPFEDDRAAILDRATLKPLVFLNGELTRANDHTARPGGSKWALSPAATFASLVADDAPGASHFAGICRTDTGEEVDWTGVGEVTAVGWDSTEKLFATLDAFTNLITVRHGLTGAVAATAPAAESQESGLVQEVPAEPDRILVGRTLFRRSDMRALLTLPDELALAPDWSWALMMEGGTASGEGGLRPANGIWPSIELVERITPPATESSTVAEKIQSLQMTLLNRRNRTVWEYLLRRETEATRLKEEIREEALKTFAYRMKRLLAKLGWPHGNRDITLGEVEALKNRAAGLHEEATGLLAERPDSDDAQFAVAACGAFLGGEAGDAARAAVESAHSAADEGESPEQNWVQLASLMALDGRPAEVELGNEWMTRHAVVKSFRDGTITPPKLLELVKGDSSGIGGDSGMLEGLAAAAEWERGRKDRAAGWVALVNASGGFASSQMPRMLEKPRGGETPYWFSLLPKTTHEAFSAAVASAPAPEKCGVAVLALARDYLAAGEKAAALYVLDRAWRGSLPFLERLESYRLACAARSVSEKEHALTLAELIAEEETDVPPAAALEFYGRVAAGGGESAAAFADKALIHLGATPDAKRTAEELLGLVGARTARNDEVGAQAAFAALLRKEPALRDEQVIEARAWTAGEARVLGRHLAIWLKSSASPAPSPAEAKLRDSRIALLHGKNAAALSAFHQALNAGAKPEPALWMRLIAAALKNDDAAGRLRLTKRALEALPQNASAHAAAALARSMAGDTGIALAALREAVSLDARFGSIEGWNAWRSEIGAGGIEVETPMFTLLNARPVEMITDPTELLNAAKSRLEGAGEDPERQLRAADAALAFTAAATRAEPKWNYPRMQHAEVLRARVTALVRLRRFPEALAACKKLVEAGVDTEDFHLPFRLAFAMKKKDRARVFIDAGSTKLPSSSGFARVAGHALLGLGDPAEALKAFERSRALLSGNDEPEDDLLAGLVVSRWLAGKRDEALSAAVAFHKQAPNGLDDEALTKLNWPPQEREALKAALAGALEMEAARKRADAF